MDDLLELTLLDRLDETEARLALWFAVARLPTAIALRCLMEPRPRPVIGLVLGLPTFPLPEGSESVVTCGASFLFPLPSSLNHILKAVKRLARLRCRGPCSILGNAPKVSAGELILGVPGGECFPVTTQGDPILFEGV